MGKYILVQWPESQSLMDMEWFNECILRNDENAESSEYFVPEERYEELVYENSENLNKPPDNDIYSRTIKFILATNYYYQIIDEIKQTKFYKQQLKKSLNEVENELDKIQRNQGMIDFYKIANEKLYMNNLDLHTLFFEQLCRMHSSMIEEHMIEFVKKNLKSYEPAKL